jgi:hypothetical protein
MDNCPRPCVSHPSIIIKSNFAHEKTTALQKHAKRWKKAYTNTPAALSAEIHPFIHTKGYKNGDLKQAMSVRERRVSAEHGAIQRFAASTVTYVHAQSPSFRCKFFRGGRMGFSRFAVIITDVFCCVNP